MSAKTKKTKGQRFEVDGYEVIDLGPALDAYAGNLVDSVVSRVIGDIREVFVAGRAFEAGFQAGLRSTPHEEDENDDD